MMREVAKRLKLFPYMHVEFFPDVWFWLEIMTARQYLWIAFSVYDIFTVILCGQIKVIVHYVFEIWGVASRLIQHLQHLMLYQPPNHTPLVPKHVINSEHALSIMYCLQLHVS